MRNLACCFQSLFVMLMAYTASFAGDMVLENEGQHFVLHEDNTWDFENKNIQDMTKDQIITLDDNRLIKLSIDYSWKFIDKAELDKAENAPIVTVVGKGVADHRVLSEASALALQKALANAATKIKTSIKNKKVNYDKLHHCVKCVEKEVDSAESFTKGKGWHVETKVTVDQGTVLACEADTEPPQDTAHPPIVPAPEME